MSVLANASISDPALATPIAKSADWREATKDLIGFLIGLGRCFSSGPPHGFAFQRAQHGRVHPRPVLQPADALLHAG